MFSAAKKYLAELKKAGEKIEPKKWCHDISTLTNEKDLQYQEMRKMREEIREIEKQKKLLEQTRNKPERPKERDLEI